MERGKGKMQNFWGTVYVAPRGRFAENEETQRMIYAQYGNIPIVDCQAERNMRKMTGVNTGDATYDCVAQFLHSWVQASQYSGSTSLAYLRKDPAWLALLDRHPQRSVEEIRGVLVHHADFWVTPPFGDGLPL